MNKMSFMQNSMVGCDGRESNPGQLLEGSYAHHYTTIAWWKNMNWLLNLTIISFRCHLVATKSKIQWLIAMAGNRTRVNCLEGSYAHHYTTIAWWKNMNWLLTWQSFPLDVI